MIKIRRDSGFTLLATGISIFAVIGMMGLAIDIGRLYIHKNESQTYTDMTALAAAHELDSTAAGITAAKARVTNSAMKWNMGASNFTNTTVKFSVDGINGWTADPSPAAGYNFVEVVTTVSGINLYFLPAVVSQNTAGVAARSVAAKLQSIEYRAGSIGTLPFAPIIINTTPPDYGFQRPSLTGGPGGTRINGDVLTLRWPANPKVGTNGQLCPADNNDAQVARAAIGGTDERGYIQKTDSHSIREAIENDDIDYTVTLGQPVTMTGGVKTTQAMSLMDRVAQDPSGPSQSVDWYLDYMALPESERPENRRIGVVPLVDPDNGFVVLAFAQVFLPMTQDVGGNRSLCAEYIGTIDSSGINGGGGGTNVTGYAVRLVQ